MTLLEGRRAIVTGGASGIGAATARTFAAFGATVAVFDVDGDGASVVADEVGGLAYAVDVADAALLDDAVAAAADALGGIDVLFNNAGVGNIKRFDRYRDDEWDRLVDVNLKGTFHGIRSVAPRMLDAGTGAIVNMASVSGLRPTRGEAPYSAAKAGVIALTQSAALEYGPTIRVNCVSPGFIRTPLTEMAAANDELRAAIERETPLARLGTAEDVAKVVAFLCSDLASYVTGQNIVVDGGSVLPSPTADPVLRAFLT